MDELYTNIFNALEADPAVAQNLYVRSQLMIRLKDRISEQGLTQTEAAERIGVSGSTINELLKGKIERFTVDALVNMLMRIGIGVEVVFKEAA